MGPAVGAIVIGCSLLIAPASSPTRTNPNDAGAPLRDAAAKTARARSFVIGVGPGGNAATITYQSPNRFQVVQRGQARPATSGSGAPSALQPATITDIYVGATRYESSSLSPNRFTSQHLSSGANAPSNLLRYLHALAAADHVTQTGVTYHFQIASLPVRAGMPGTPASGDATVLAGYLKTFTFQFNGTGPTAATLLSFAKINQPIRIGPPPAGQIAPSTS